MKADDDVIIGCIDNYGWDQIKYWVNSIKKSGFTGKKVMIVFNAKKDTVQKLVDNDFTVYAFDTTTEGDFQYRVPYYNVCVERFGAIWHFLSKVESPIRYIISTDVRDVVFQKNPSEYLNLFEGSSYVKLIASSENLLYKDEPWSKNNIEKSFGSHMFEFMKDKEIYCAGVIAGRRKWFLDLCLDIYLKSKSAKPHIEGGGGPDQAAYNITLNFQPWTAITHFAPSNDQWACQAGTTWHAVKAGSGAIGEAYVRGEHDILRKFIKADALFGENGVIVTPNLENYYIVHQYDRIPAWKKAIEEKYAV